MDLLDLDFVLYELLEGLCLNVDLAGGGLQFFEVDKGVADVFTLANLLDGTPVQLSHVLNASGHLVQQINNEAHLDVVSAGISYFLQLSVGISGMLANIALSSPRRYNVLMIAVTLDKTVPQCLDHLFHGVVRALVACFVLRVDIMVKEVLEVAFRCLSHVV